MKIGRSHGILIFITFFALAYKLIFVWSGHCEGVLIADDAYYYFTIAKNIAAGLGPTFDRLSPTNGFHPLWLAILIPLFKLSTTNLWVPIRMALSLTILFDLFSGILIFKLLDNKSIKSAAPIAASIWFLSPFTLLIGLRGMEVSLSCLITLIICWFLFKESGSSGYLSLKPLIITGVILGIAGLARTDNLLILGLTITVFVIMLNRKRGFIKTLLSFIPMALSAIIIMLPWFLWNFHKFGSIMQVSGQAKFYFAAKVGSLFAGWQSLIGIIQSISYTVLAPLVLPSKFLVGEEFQSPRISVLVILLLIAIIIIAVFFTLKAVRGKSEYEKFSPLVLFSMIYLVVHVVVYGFILRFYAVWYALPFFAFISIILGIAIAAMKKGARLQIMIKIIIILFGLSIHLLFLFRNDNRPRSPVAYYGQTLSEISRFYPNGAVVGAFNAGALGYITSSYGNLTVVNLDCLVNNKAFEAVKRGRYFDYLVRTVDIFYEDPREAQIFLKPEETDSLCAIFKKHDGQKFWSKAKPDK